MSISACLNVFWFFRANKNDDDVWKLSVCVVFDKHKACLLRHIGGIPLIALAVAQKCPMPEVPGPGTPFCMWDIQSLADVSRSGFHRRLPALPRNISKTDAARITKLDVPMFRDKCLNVIYFGVKQIREKGHE